MKKRKFGLNYILNTSYQLISLLTPLVSLPYLSRMLGTNGLGLYSFNYSILSYFILLATLGTSTFGSREIAYRQENKEEYSKVFGEIFLLRLFFVFISCILYAFYIILFGLHKKILLIFFPMIINVALDITWFMNGHELFSLLVKRTIVVKALYLPTLFYFVKSPNDLYNYIIIEVIFTISSNLILWPGIKKLIIYVQKIRPFTHVKRVFILFLPSLATQIYTVLDKTMIGLFSKGVYSENGFYEQAQGITKSCLFLVYSLVTIMSPVIAQCFAKKDYDSMKKYLYRSYKAVWLITLLITVVIFTIAKPLVDIYYGPNLDKTIYIIRFSCPLFIIIGLSTITGLQYFIPCGKEKSLTLSLFIGAATNIILNLLIIPKYQSVGAAFASVIAELCVTITQFIIVFRIKDIKVHKILLSSIKYIVAGLFTGVFGYLSLKLLHNNLSSMLISTLIMILVYFIVLLIQKEELTNIFLQKQLKGSK